MWKPAAVAAYMCVCALPWRQKDAANNCVIIFLSSSAKRRRCEEFNYYILYTNNMIFFSPLIYIHKCQNEAKKYDLQFSLFFSYRFHIWARECVCVRVLVFIAHTYMIYACIIFVERPPWTLCNRSVYVCVRVRLLCVRCYRQSFKTIDIVHIYNTIRDLYEF